MNFANTHLDMDFQVEDFLNRITSKAVEHFNRNGAVAHTALLVEFTPDGMVDVQPVPHGAQQFFDQVAQKREDELVARIFQSMSADRQVGLLTVFEAWGRLVQHESDAGGPHSRIEREDEPALREEFLVIKLRLRGSDTHLHALKLRTDRRAVDFKAYRAPRDFIQKGSRQSAGARKPERASMLVH